VYGCYRVLAKEAIQARGGNRGTRLRELKATIRERTFMLLYYGQSNLDLPKMEATFFVAASSIHRDLSYMRVPR
jgi:hypothetical protein